jgi:Spy/CpxP family protein refolding chaperone
MNAALAFSLAQAPDSGAARQMPTPDQVVAKMSEKLNLTADQKTQITPIIADRQQKMEALRGDTSMDRREKGQKMRAIYEDSDTKIKAVLTGDQKQKYEAMEQQARSQMRQRVREQQSPQ